MALCTLGRLYRLPFLVFANALNRIYAHPSLFKHLSGCPRKVAQQIDLKRDRGILTQPRQEPIVYPQLPTESA
jgi:hypothetical protein